MDFILGYLMSNQESQEVAEVGTQFTDLPPDALARIAEYQESEIASAGNMARHLGQRVRNMREGMTHYERALGRGQGVLDIEMEIIREGEQRWREELGRAILVNNWLRRVGGMVRMNPAQMLQLQRRHFR
tara:strand:- start:1372 stop:1761 length:390 start_codon:yes stop_codon:yes gene_type:complete